MREMIFGILDLTMEYPAIFATIWLMLSLVSLGMMIGEIVRSPGRRLPAALVLAVAIAFAAANMGTLVVTVMVDSFTLFELVYIIPAGLVAPALMLALFHVVIKKRWPVGRPGTAGFSMWTVCVTFAHLFAIAALSASV